MRPRLCACLAIAAATALAGCGSSSPKTNTASSGSASAVSQIKKNWVAFFNPSTSASSKIPLLQNGTQFAPVINAQSKSPFAKEASAKVTAVKLTSATTATVTYTVLLAGSPVKTFQASAVKTGSTWQVADASFCQLLKLQGAAPPACPKG